MFIDSDDNVPDLATRLANLDLGPDFFESFFANVMIEEKGRLLLIYGVPFLCHPVIKAYSDDLQGYIGREQLSPWWIQDA
jgi:hypothetical protein